VIANNRVFENGLKGISARTGWYEIIGNRVQWNGTYGIELEGVMSGSKVALNSLVGNGLLVQGSGARVARNDVDRSVAGILASPVSAQNVFIANVVRLSEQGYYSCEDYGTGNLWELNRANRPSQPAGICQVVP
jgi:hypothetical protein